MNLSAHDVAFISNTALSLIRFQSIVWGAYDEYIVIIAYLSFHKFGKLIAGNCVPLLE
jgi:hypothetical protein